MACFSDEQIESLALLPDDGSQVDLWNHVEKCSNCRMRIEQCLAGSELVRDIQELRQRRQSLDPLLERLNTEGQASGLAPDDPV